MLAAEARSRQRATRVELTELMEYSEDSDQDKANFYCSFTVFRVLRGYSDLDRGLKLRELIIRILRRSIPVAIALAIMGYLFAEALLLAERMNNAHPDPANQAVRWTAPIRMACIGVAVLIIFEVIGFVIKGKKPAHPVDPDTEPQNAGTAK